MKPIRMMLTALALLALPLQAVARCEANDLIAALPEDARADLQARADAQAYAEGLYWRAEKAGTQITLFGTYHFPHDRTEAHLEALKPAVAAAEQVFLEVSNGDQARLQRELARDPSIMFLMEGPTLPDLLGEADWTALKTAMGDRNIPGFMAAKFKPVWAAILLGVGPCEARAGALEGNGIDHRIGEYAGAIGNPSRSLEDYRALLTMLDDTPLKEQLDMIRLFLAMPQDPDDMAYTLRQRYLAQEVALIWEYSRKISIEEGGPGAQQDFELLEQQLLIGRNHDWMEVLRAQAPGRSSFVAVGAAHLPGPHGVLKLLADEGYTITRLPFDP